MQPIRQCEELAEPRRRTGVGYDSSHAVVRMQGTIRPPDAIVLLDRDPPREGNMDPTDPGQAGAL